MSGRVTARNKCQEFGGQLLEIQNATKQSKIEAMLERIVIKNGNKCKFIYMNIFIP